MQPTLTIGIPAYNEQANIKNLLSSLLAQKQTEFVLEKIIVVSDGSTDNTAAIVKSFSDPRIELVEFGQRQGIAAAQNKIISSSDSDVLVLVDADVIPTADTFLEEITKPILADPKVALVGAAIVSKAGRNILERVISFSHEFKTHMYKSINKGDNLYLCHGRARAFGKNFYKHMRWVAPYDEDAFSYLLCRQLGHRFVFAPKASVLFRSPSNLHDYIIQSRRFLSGAKFMASYFSDDLVKKSYNIPLSVVVKAAGLYFTKNPLKFLAYLLLYGHVRFFSGYQAPDGSYFEISQSTKKVTE